MAATTASVRMVHDAGAAAAVLAAYESGAPARPLPRKLLQPAAETAAQRRISRLRQVRAQEAAFSTRLVREYESKKVVLERAAVAEAATDWQEDRAAREAQLRADYSAAMDMVGHSHAAARQDTAEAEDLARQQYWSFVRCRAEDEKRFAVALDACRTEQLEREKAHRDMVERKELVVAVERQRAGEAAALRARAQELQAHAHAPPSRTGLQLQDGTAPPVLDYTSTHMHSTMRAPACLPHGAVRQAPATISAADAAQHEHVQRESSRRVADEEMQRRRDDAQARGNVALAKVRAERERLRVKECLENMRQQDWNGQRREAIELAAANARTALERSLGLTTSPDNGVPQRAAAQSVAALAREGWRPMSVSVQARPLSTGSTVSIQATPVDLPIRAPAGDHCLVAQIEQPHATVVSQLPKDESADRTAVRRHLENMEHLEGSLGELVQKLDRPSVSAAPDSVTSAATGGAAAGSEEDCEGEDDDSDRADSLSCHSLSTNNTYSDDDIEEDDGGVQYGEPTASSSEKMIIIVRRRRCCLHSDDALHRHEKPLRVRRLRVNGQGSSCFIFLNHF
eukprot:SAG22_NODE_66_length_22936_cov_626.714279_4_plen_571_part_00